MTLNRSAHDDKLKSGPDNSPFDMICKAAINQNIEELKEVLSCVSVNVNYKKNLGDPITLLAAQGEVKAVDFLLGFGAHLTSAALGFALSKNMLKAKEILEKVKNDNPIDASSMVMNILSGLALGGHTTEAYNFLKSIEQDYADDFLSLLDTLANAFAQSGSPAEANNVLEILRKNHQKKNVKKTMEEINYRPEEDLQAEISFIRSTILEGFALSGHMSEIDNLVKNEYKNDYTPVLDTIIMHLAQGGHKKKADHLLKEIKSGSKHEEQTLSALQSMVFGFAKNGYVEEALEVLQKIENDNPTQMLSLLVSLIKGLARGGHTAKAYEFLKMVQNKYPEETVSVLGWIAYNFTLGRHAAEVYAHFAKLKNDDPNNLDDVLHWLTLTFGENECDLEAIFKKKFPSKTVSVMKEMVRGFALNGSQTETFLFLKMLYGAHGVESNFRLTSLRSLAFNVASSRNREEVSTLVATVNDQYPYYNNNVLIEIAYGFIHKGEAAEAYNYLITEKHSYSEEVFGRILGNLAFQLAAEKQVERTVNADDFLKEVKSNHSAYITLVLGETLRGYIVSNHREKANTLFKTIEQDNNLQQIHTALQYIGQGISYTGNMEEIDTYLEMVDNKYPHAIGGVLARIVSNLIDCEHVMKAYLLLDKVRAKYPYDISQVVIEMATSERAVGKVTDRGVALHTLTSIEPMILRQLFACELKRATREYNSITRLIDSATDFMELMERKEIHNFSYSQVVGWVQPETRDFLLNSRLWTKRSNLSTNLLSLIATFLVPITSPDAKELLKKLTSYRDQIRLFKKTPECLEDKSTTESDKTHTASTISKGS